MNDDTESREHWRKVREGLWYDDRDLPEPEPYCGVYWIITTCLTGIALGIGLGALLWLVLGVWS